MRVLLISSSSGSHGGGEIFLVYLAEALRARGHTPGLWISDHARMDDLAKAFAPHGEVLRSAYPWFYDSWHRGLLTWRGNPATQARFRHEWSSWRPDVLHLNKQCLEDGLDLLGAAAAQSTLHLTTVHITQPARQLGARFGRWRDARARRSLRRYPGPLVTVSPARAADLRRELGPGPRIESNPNGVPLIELPHDRAALRRTEGLQDGECAVVGVGRLEEQKRPLEFLRQIRCMRDAGIAVSGRWIGDGRLQSAWDVELDRLDLRSVVRQDRWRSDVRAVLPAFDLFLHTAAFEGLPLALLEAFQAGLPCFVSAEVAAELPQDLAEFVHRIADPTDWSSLLHDSSRLTAHGAAGRAHAREHYSTGAMAARYESLYRELIRT